MANAVYNRGKYLQASGGITTAADLRVLLVDETYVFDATHNTVSDVIAGSAEIAGAGYARATLANKTITEDDANGFAYLDADDAAMGSIVTGETIGGAILYKHDAGGDSASQVIAFYDLTNTPTNGAAITVQWNTPANGGVLKLS
jgi:hypothetical protein